MNDQRFSSSSGIAIGPILFIIAMLAVLATAMSSGGNNFQITGTVDRINADIVTQANLIRSTIGNCNMQYMVAISNNTGLGVTEMSPSSDPYPCSDTTNGSAVSILTCSPLVDSPVCPPLATQPADGSSLWNNAVKPNTVGSVLGNITLPPPTKGFNAWTYINAGETGGRCFWTSPSTANPVNDQGIVAGLTRAASKFNYSASVDVTHEVVYNPASASQKFVVWVTMPNSVGDADSHCVP